MLFEKDKSRLLEYEALMRDQRAALCLTKATLNVSSLVDGDQAAELLEKMREALTAEERERAERERIELEARLKREMEDAVAASQQKVKSEQEKHEAADRELLNVRRAIAGLRAESEGRRQDATTVSKLLSEVTDKVGKLEAVNHASLLAVRSAVIQEIRAIGLICIGVAVVCYAALGASIQWIGGSSPWVVFGIFVLGGLGFWIVPGLLLRPALRWWLLRKTRSRLKVVEGTAGIKLDAVEVVEAVIALLKLDR